MLRFRSAAETLESHEVMFTAESYLVDIVEKSRLLHEKIMKDSVALSNAKTVSI